MKQLLLSIKIEKAVIIRVIAIALLTFLFTNISQAQLEAGQQAISLLSVSSSGTSDAEYDYDINRNNSGANFILELVPGAFLFSPDMDGFEVTYNHYPYYETQKIDGIGSWIPNLRAGVRINSPVVSFDITGGGGYLLNGAISGPFFLGDLAANFHVSDSFNIGPHVGLISFGDLDWYNFDDDSYFSDADVEFSGNTGFMGGLTMSAGSSVARFYLSIDYISAEFDVEAGSGWVPNRDKLDLTGAALQLGLLLKF